MSETVQATDFGAAALLLRLKVDAGQGLTRDETAGLVPILQAAARRERQGVASRNLLVTLEEVDAVKFLEASASLLQRYGAAHSAADMRRLRDAVDAALSPPTPEDSRAARFEGPPTPR